MTAWHASPVDLHHYRLGTVDELAALSIEAHLERCALCRETIAESADPLLLESMWDRIADRVDQPAVGVVERLLCRIGLEPGTARLVAATPALRLAWIAAVALVVGVVTVGCIQWDSDGPFLALAPLLPLAGVAAAFAPGTDPAGEVGLATPLFGFGLVLRRAEVVLASSFAVLLLGALALPGLDGRDAGWVLPALALSSAAVALSWRFSVVSVAAVLGSTWVTAVSVLAYRGAAGVGVAETVLFSAAGQLAFALAFAVAVVATCLHPDVYPTQRGA